MPVSLQNRRQGPRLTTPRARAIARAIMDALECPLAELSVTLTDDSTVAKLNASFRGKNRPTDVLSFSQIEEATGDKTAKTAKTPMDPRGFRGPLGDVVVSYDTAMAQAAAAGHSLEQEIVRLLIHGVLHLLGHDHVHGGRQAGRMRRQEGRLLARLATVERRS